LQKEPLKSVAVKIQHGELPGELDYFKYAAGGKRKADGDATTAVKKRKVEEVEDEDEDMDEEEEADAVDDTPSRPRQRVVTKGANVPAHADTFTELVERYQMSSLLLSNLSLHGYTHPTGIQSYGIPILLEVS
jgi:ATP-dependent RNA helicase DDX52/ROK1